MCGPCRGGLVCLPPCSCREGAGFASFDNYSGLANELERLLQCPVGLVTERSVRNAYFRQVIEATRQPGYEG